MRFAISEKHAASTYRNVDVMRLAITRGMLSSALVAVGLMSMSPGCDQRSGSEAKKEASTEMTIHYLEIVSDDTEALATFYERVHGLSFGAPDPDMGQARVATRSDGTLVGIRKPLAAHEQPIVRTYIAVDDIQQAVEKAEQAGATVAYPPTRQGQRGTFAILFQGGVQHGLWQR